MYIFVDASFKLERGSAGIGVVVVKNPSYCPDSLYLDKSHKVSFFIKGLQNVDSNLAEFQAILMGLRAATKGLYISKSRNPKTPKRIYLFTDSAHALLVLSDKERIKRADRPTAKIVQRIWEIQDRLSANFKIVFGKVSAQHKIEHKDALSFYSSRAHILANLARIRLEQNMGFPVHQESFLRKELPGISVNRKTVNVSKVDPFAHTTSFSVSPFRPPEGVGRHAAVPTFARVCVQAPRKVRGG